MDAPKRRNPIARLLRGTRLFHQRRERNRKKYTRKGKGAKDWRSGH